MLTEGCWFTPRNNQFLQLWKLTVKNDLIRLTDDVKHQLTSHQLTSRPLIVGKSKFLEGENVKIEPGIQFIQIQHPQIMVKHLYAGHYPNLPPTLIFPDKGIRL